MEVPQRSEAENVKTNARLGANRDLSSGERAGYVMYSDLILRALFVTWIFFAL
jgi:hypothetical protein